MPTNSYWNQRNKLRVTRRRMLQGTGSLAGLAAAAMILGCGDGDDDSPQSTAPASITRTSSTTTTTGPAGSTVTSTATGSTGGATGSTAGTGLVHIPTDTTSNAVPGGIFHGVDSNNIQSLEPFYGGFEATFLVASYSRLVGFKASKYPEPITQAIAPDVATSWEVSPGGLEHIYKIRQGMKFDPRPPTNGRDLTPQDVLFSLERFEAISPIANQLMASIEPSSPIESWSAPDEQTVVIRTAFPYSPLNSYLANFRYVTIIPTETFDEGFNAKVDMRGTGAWRLDEFQPGSQATFSKNPDWYNADKIHLDGIAYASIQEYATQLAQFRAGNLSTMQVNGQDILPLKSDLPSLLMTEQEAFPLSASWIRFDYKDGSPFRDERVRQAMSMLVDRQLFINVFGNAEEFEKKGLQVRTRWNTAVPCGEEGFWLDPEDMAEFGDTAKYFQFNPEEAKALLRAAGHDGPIQTSITTRTDSPSVTERAEVLAGMWEANQNFTIERRVVDNRSDFTPNYSNNYDRHDGIAYSVAAPAPDVDAFLNIYYRSNQPRTGHVDASGAPDLVMDDFLDKQRQAPDPGQRASILHDFQRYAAEKMYLLYEMGAALSFDLASPTIGNWDLYRSRAGGSQPQETFIYYWYDASKA